MIKLVIFDFDDTLIDNQILDYQSFKETSLKMHSYIPSKNEIKNLRKKKYDAIKMIDWIKKNSTSSFNKEKFFNQRKNFLESKYSEKFLKLQPYVKSTIKKLKSKDLILAISSLRKKKSLIKHFLESKGILSFIDQIVTVDETRFDTRSENIGIKLKNRHFKKILNNYGILESETISVGDSISDFKAAKMCSIKHVTFQSATDYIIKPKLGKSIHSFKDLTHVIEKYGDKKEFR